MDAAAAYEPRAAVVRIRSPGGDGDMAYLDFGPRDRLVDAVFLHANGFNGRTYRAILAPLADHLRILAVDQRGHGATRLSTETEGRNTWYGLRDDLIGFLHALGLEDVVLAGHSMGGTAATLAAAREPKLARGLVLFDPVVISSEARAVFQRGGQLDSPLVEGARRRRAQFPSREAVFEAYQGRGAFKTWPREMLRDYIQAGFKDREDGTVELACSPEWETSNFVSHAHDTWGALRAVQCPTHILRAENASACQIAEIEQELIASGRLRVETVPGTTHFLPMERPDLARAALREAVEG
ncbi:MAG: alpha/beta fold hydrolase [Caulobacterales bacterium]